MNEVTPFSGLFESARVSYRLLIEQCQIHNNNVIAGKYKEALLALDEQEAELNKLFNKLTKKMNGEIE
jgi:hypothetical protein